MRAITQKPLSKVHKTPDSMERLSFLYKLLGETDISSIEDGTVTGILKELKNVAFSESYNDLKNKPLTMPASDVHSWAKQERKPTYNKSDVGLEYVDNTSDEDKPVSKAQQTALDKKMNFTDITQSTAVNIAGKKALDAIEKNPSVNGTLAHDISQINSDIIEKLDNLEENVDELSKKVGSMAGNVGLVLRLISIDEYKALQNYNNNTVYLCYIDELTKRVVRIFVGEDSVYAAGVKVKYHINTDDVAERIVSEMEDAIGSAPGAVMNGYVFVGWRQDNLAEKKVLSEYIIDSEESVELYAVFKKETNISIRLMPNGGTLAVSDAKESFTADYYYNNGNYQSELVTIPQNPYTRNGMSFCGWSIDSVAPPAYIPGEIKTIKGDGMLYAMWVRTEVEFPYTGEYVEFFIPQNGIYEFEVWGGAGCDAENGSLVAEGGLGGHSKGYKKMQRGDVVYVFPGGAGSSIGGTGPGANGGGRGGSNSRNNKYGSNGGGATNITTDSSSFKNAYENRSKILIVAGGGGGGAIDGTTINKGGAGGGEQGGNGSNGVLGGRQISLSSDPAYSFGHAQALTSFSETDYGVAGGGGGWYGGNYGSRGPSGGGGSGYIDGVASFTHNGKYYPAETEAGVNRGNGRAFIRYIDCI